MKQFIGTKMLLAVAMTLGAYNEKRGWDIPKDEDPTREGYFVEYPDGYVSWSPKEVFEESYRETTAMNFGLAVEAMKMGKKVARTGWNGKGMFLYLVSGSSFNVNRPPLLGIYEENTPITYRPHMDLRTADGSVATWSPSGSDALADDWFIVE